MIFFETTGTTPGALDTLAVLVSQLRWSGVAAAIPAKATFYANSAYQQYDLAQLITEASVASGDQLVLIDAHNISDASLVDLRRHCGNGAVPCLAVGRFETTQSEISAKSKLSYVLGTDPQILSTFDRRASSNTAEAPVIGVRARRPNRAASGIPTVLLFDPNLDDPNLKFLAASRKFKVIVMTGGKQKQAWIRAHGTTMPIYHYSEILPAHVSSMVDIFVNFREPSLNYRVQTLIANMLAEGAVMIDCSQELGHAKSTRYFIQGPHDAIGLLSHLSNDVLPRLDEVRGAVRRETVRILADHARIIARLSGERRDPPAQPVDPEPAAGPRRAVIVPTNGVGLGHAQRTSLIATDLDRTKVNPVFAAFPSCIKMINCYGFDAMPLVSRTGYHEQAHANDMVNYLRLHGLSRDASTLVFDGGYVFDSIYRTIFDHGLNGVWIRRGMWQAGQDNTVSLDREKVFGRVIVPAEAFDELNQTYSTGDHIREVGPIVQKSDLDPAAQEEMRAALAERFGKSFDKLVITMLGGGLAAKRSAQIQAICGMMEARDDALHLVVVWPTATVEVGTFTWKNSRVVKTHHASTLVAASDLYISAVGYNSFHEVLYNGVPTIFMPQMSSFMDDQRARAMAAVERGLAAMVEASQLTALRQEIAVCLDGGKSERMREQLAGWSLPEPGNRAAAAIIEEMV